MHGLKLESYAVLFLGGHFLFIYWDTFSARCVQQYDRLQIGGLTFLNTLYIESTQPAVCRPWRLYSVYYTYPKLASNSHDVWSCTHPAFQQITLVIGKCRETNLSSVHAGVFWRALHIDDIAGARLVVVHIIYHIR